MTSCKSCGYERLSTDDAPDWQCPSCGVAYVKSNSAGVRRAQPTQESRGQPSSPPPAARPRATAERFVEARVAGATLADSHVVITDVRIPFWSLVWLLVKLAFAAIPAAILVTVIWMIVIGLIGGMLQPHSL